MLSAIAMPVGHFLLAVKKNIPNEKSCQTCAALS
jgi:hypothetical protein